MINENGLWRVSQFVIKMNQRKKLRLSFESTVNNQKLIGGTELESILEKNQNFVNKKQRGFSVWMVENQTNLCHFSYLGKAIFKPSKMKRQFYIRSFEFLGTLKLKTISL